MLPTSYSSLVEPVLRRGRDEPDRPGLVFIDGEGGSATVTAAQMADRMRRVAGGLRRAGIGSGDVVVFLLPDSCELIECFLGAMCAGAIPAVFAGHLSGRVDFEVLCRRVLKLLDDTAARALVVSEARRDGVAALAAGRAVLSAEALAEALPVDDRVPAALAHDSVALIQFTSGSGGVQKGVPHTHGAILRYLVAAGGPQPVEPHDVIVSWLPLSHDLGLFSNLLVPQTLGARTVLLSPLQWVREPHLLLRAISDYRGTICFMPNFALNHCARAIRERDLDGIDLRTLSSLVCGGEPVRLASQETFLQRFGPYGLRPEILRAGYGMAEVIEAATLTPAGVRPRVDWVEAADLRDRQRATPASPASGAHSIVSCGAPLPDSDVRIVDADGAPLPERCVGEITLRSPWMFRGYYRAPALTAESLRHGWLFTGDLGYLADGELYVTGRQKDLIIVGGRNLAPEDIELLADGVPGIAPGRTVAFGVADAQLGTERAVLVCESAAPLAAGPAVAIERELRRRAAATFDVALGDVRIVGRGWIIKTSSGKTARPDNREKYLAEFARRRDEAEK